MVRNREKGTVLALMAILLPVLLCGLGLVFDNGQAFDMKRRTQKAADAGAIAAAQELRRGNKNTYHKAALDSAKLNGMPVGDAEVNVYNPPKTGIYQGKTDYVEVEVRHDAPLYFMRALYDDGYKVESRAVAGVIDQTKCVISLNKTASPGLLVNGTADVDVGKCGVQVNSNASQAGRTNGGGTLKAAHIDIVGNYSGVGFAPTPLTGAEEMADPLIDVPAPTWSKCDFNNTVVKANTTLDPGVYCGGLTLNSQTVTTLKPGVYILAGGGLTVNGGATLQGDGVMFYNTSGGKGKGTAYAPISFAGNSTTKLTAPTSGTYKGILFFTDRTISGGKDNQLAGTNDSYWTGALYFPHVPVDFVGTVGLQAQELLFICDTVRFTGNISFKQLSASSLAPTIQKALLVY